MNQKTIRQEIVRARSGRGAHETHAEAKINVTDKIVHLLDLNGPTSLTNGIETVKGKLESENYLEGYRWILYHTDCFISEWKHNDFKVADKDVIDAEFREHMIDMYKDFYK